MRDHGAALHLGYVDGKPYWALSNGTRVDAAVAGTLIQHPQIVGVGDALPFPGVRVQTYRYCEVRRL
jgi:hypothetical protein